MYMCIMLASSNNNTGRYLVYVLSSVVFLGGTLYDIGDLLFERIISQLKDHYSVALQILIVH